MTDLLLKDSLGPLINPQSHILILGTAPGELSLKHKQYYANPVTNFGMS